jgi:metallo-beta-lactamase family protein
LPLYTEDDARRTLASLREVPFDVENQIDGAAIILRRTGHILGAASIELRCDNLTVLFSGDLGRYGDPIFNDPSPIFAADYLVVESTYGDRQHDRIDPEHALLEIVSRTVGRGGTVVIPSFAVGRAQSLLYHIHRLKKAGEISNVPVFLDSPMAVDASEVFCRNVEDHKLPERECRLACATATYVRSTEESKALTVNPVPKIIISASGMATGGRVLHHLKRYAPDPKSTILFAGFQAPGTRGATMMDGARFVRIHGDEIPVRAEVQNLPMLSAHGDSDEILRWCRSFRSPPRMTFVTHGESRPAQALSARLEQELGWKCKVPQYLEEFNLS